jgi:hypothetical protein
MNSQSLSLHFELVVDDALPNTLFTAVDCEQPLLKIEGLPL